MNGDVRARLESLEHRQAMLRQELAGLDEALAGLKDSLRYGPPVDSTPAPTGPAPAPALPPLPAFEADPQPQPAPESRATPPPTPPPLPAQARPPENSLEMKVGTVWLARIGIVIVLTGLIFLGNFAWQSLVENFGSLAKLGLLYLAGATLCAAGLLIERRRESLKNYASVLLAGGLASIYYTTYAAHYVPSLRIIGSPLLAGLLLVALAGIIGWMADRRNSQSTAGLAIALAFYASAVNQLTYFTLFSNALLGIAAVVLMIRKRWMVVPFLAMAATYWSYLYWRLAENWRFWEVSRPGDADLTVRLAFLSVYWMVFTAGIFLTGTQKFSGRARVVFSTLNDAAFFSLAAVAISWSHQASLWIIALVFGVVQLALSLAARAVHGPGTLLASAWLAKALFFLTLAVLIRFTGDSLAIILAMECSLLVFASSQLPSRVLASAGPLAGALAMMAAMVSLAASGTTGAAGLVAVLLLANAWFCGRGPAISLRSLVLSFSGMALAAAVLVDRLPDEWEAAGPALLGLIFVAGLPLHHAKALTIAGLLAAGGSIFIQLAMLESAGFWPSLSALGLLAATAVTGPLVSGRDISLRTACGILALAAGLLFWGWVKTYVPEGHQFWLMALAAAGTLSLSRGKPLRQALSVIFSIAALLLFLGHGAGSQARFEFGDLFGGLLLLGQERLSRVVRAPVALARFAGISGVLALLLWVTSAVRFFQDPLPLTAAWALLALALFLAGFLLRARAFRLGGLGILGLALARIVLLDVWRLDLPFRILSFLILGSVLLVLGYFYNRYAERIRQWL